MSLASAANLQVSVACACDTIARINNPAGKSFSYRFLWERDIGVSLVRISVNLVPRLLCSTRLCARACVRSRDSRTRGTLSEGE